jgi:hypothetical protein
MIAKIARSRMMLHRNPFLRNIVFSLFAGFVVLVIIAKHEIPSPGDCAQSALLKSHAQVV